MNKTIQDELDLDRGVTVSAEDLKVDVQAFNRECERTQKGKNICPKCKKPKQMYYRPWCPGCEKPEMRTIQTLNFLQAVYHIERIDGDEDKGDILDDDFQPGYKKRMWGYLDDRYILQGNDQVTFWPFVEQWEVDAGDYDAVCLRDENRFREVFDLTEEDGVHLEVSW